jgi:hypothetical protein
MKTASIQELKEEMNSLPPKKLVELCLRMARYKKENKELLTYLLFEAHDEQEFVSQVKKEIDEQFEELPKPTPYLTKKNLRKVLRALTKYSRHTGTKESALEMLLHFCRKLNESGIDYERNKMLSNIYTRQIEKLNALVKDLHEDLQYDYKRQIEALS